MGYRKSWIGRVFGQLTVIAFHSNHHHRDSLWLCRCSCGKEKAILRESLRSGRTLSCGCLRSKRVSECRSLDITGETFGRLTAIRPHSKNGGGILWLCKCSCGEEKLAYASRLKQGAIISCGCAKKDLPGLTHPQLLLKSSVSYHKRRARIKGSSGSFTKTEIEELYKKQSGLCAWCKVNLNGQYDKDHILALANGGNNNIDNIQLLCPSCNRRKGKKFWTAVFDRVK